MHEFQVVVAVLLVTLVGVAVPAPGFVHADPAVPAVVVAVIAAVDAGHEDIDVVGGGAVIAPGVGAAVGKVAIHDGAVDLAAPASIRGGAMTERPGEVVADLVVPGAHHIVPVGEVGAAAPSVPGGDHAHLG